MSWQRRKNARLARKADRWNSKVSLMLTRPYDPWSTTNTCCAFGTAIRKHIRL